MHTTVKNLNICPAMTVVLILFQTVPDFSEPEFSDIDDIESLISLQTDDLSEGTLFPTG